MLSLVGYRFYSEAAALQELRRLGLDVTVPEFTIPFLDDVRNRDAVVRVTYPGIDYSGRPDESRARFVFPSEAISSLRKVRRAFQLDLRRSTLDDAQLNVIAADNLYLERLVVMSTNVTEKSLPAIASCRNLTGLSLSGCKIEPASLRALSQLDRLTWISLDDVPAGDEDLAWIGGLPVIENVYLKHTRAADATLISLSQAATLKRVDVGHTQITDEGVRRFCDGKMRRFIWFSCEETKVSDEALTALLRLGRIENLNFLRTRATGKPLLEVEESSIRRLSTVAIDESEWTARVVERLSKTSAADVVARPKDTTRKSENVEKN